jgi:hypothetical protein
VAARHGGQSAVHAQSEGRRADGAKADLLKVEFNIPQEYQVEALDWSASNASRLFEIGKKSGLSFCDVHAGQLGSGRVRA